MLSVFITPCTNPTRIHSTTISAVRVQTCANQLTTASLDSGRLSKTGATGAVRATPIRSASHSPMFASVNSRSARSVASSRRDVKICAFPNRKNVGATRHTIAPGSQAARPS